MTPDASRALDVFARALDLDPAERPAFVARACGEDDALMREVLSLLSSHDTSDDFLETPILTPSGVVPDLEATPPPARVGTWEIGELIGSGGMSRVYRGRRVGDFEQTVAVKLIRPGLVTEDLERRFRVERQVLARLEHPHIARLIDGGISDGIPFLVMETVDGEPIDTYCQRHDLSVETRLELVRSVSRAVHHAHRNLVVHRDLKPSNILVTADGVPKLLDFGIAKLLEDDGLDVDATAVGVQAFTPRFASPEQILGDPITTATDVYSLGVLLAVVVTGRAPYRNAETPSDLRRSVTVEPPVAPSTMAREAGTRLPRHLADDIDTIALAALNKDPALRYASADELGDDIDRLLRGQPVAARTDSPAYRARKFVRRNRLAVIAAGTVVVALGLTAVISTVERQKAEAARARAESEQETVEAINAFLSEMLSGADPIEGGNPADIRVRELLDRASERLAASGPDDARVLSSLHRTIASTYHNLALYEEALPHAERAIESARATDDPERITQSLITAAGIEHRMGRYDDSERHLRSAYEVALSVPGWTDGVVECTRSLARILIEQGRYEEAEPFAREAVDVLAEAAPSRQKAEAANELGIVAHFQGRTADAEVHIRDAIGIARVAEDCPDAKLGEFLNNLGFMLGRLGKLPDAAPYYREALAIYERIYDPTHPEIAITRANLGDVLLERGELDDALALYESALATFRDQLGDDHPNVGHTTNKIARAHARRGEHGQARSAHETALATFRQAYGDEHPHVATTLMLLARCQLAVGDLGAAERAARESRRIRAAVLKVDHPGMAEIDSLVAEIERARHGD